MDYGMRWTYRYEDGGEKSGYTSGCSMLHELTAMVRLCDDAVSIVEIATLGGEEKTSVTKQADGMWRGFTTNIYGDTATVSLDPFKTAGTILCEDSVKPHVSC